MGGQERKFVTCQPLSIPLLIASTLKPIKKPKVKQNLLLDSMAKPHQSFLLLLLLIATVSATSPLANTSSSSGGNPLSTFPQPQEDQQLRNIIDAMIGSGDFNFNSWGDMISLGDLAGASFSVSATFFIPSNDFRFPLDPFIFPYHIVPQRLSFSDLLLLKPLSRLPTLLPLKSILVTNTSASNFTLDNSLVFYPDVYLTSSIAVHGIQNILDYSVYGGSSLSPPSFPPPPPPPPPPPASGDLFVEEGEVADGGRVSSDAAPCLCREFPVIFLVVFGVLAFKVYGNLLGV